jgi:hypothetical protein
MAALAPRAQVIVFFDGADRQRGSGSPTATSRERPLFFACTHTPTCCFCLVFWCARRAWPDLASASRYDDDATARAEGVRAATESTTRCLRSSHPS